MALNLAAVDREVTEVVEQFLGAVGAADEREELGGICSESASVSTRLGSNLLTIDERCPALSGDVGRMRQQGGEERNVGLEATNSEFDQGTQHLSARNFVGGAMARYLDQHRVVVGLKTSAMIVLKPAGIAYV